MAQTARMRSRPIAYYHHVVRAAFRVALLLSAERALGDRRRSVPPDYISWARAATDAPLVISETGYATVADGGAVGSRSRKSSTSSLMAQGESQNAEFVTWFFSTDPRYAKVPPGIAFINSFKSMGLATRRFQPKPALDVWRSYLALPLVPGG